MSGIYRMHPRAAEHATREQQTLDALRMLADKAHKFEACNLIDNVYEYVRIHANSQGIRFTTSQLHVAIEQSNREYHALSIVRAELRAMVDAEELNAKPHGMYARRNGCTTLLGRYPNFDVARQAVRDQWDATTDRDNVGGLNDELGRYTFTNEHGVAWIYVAPCDKGE